MGNACFAGLLEAGLHPYKAMLPASSFRQKGRAKCALRHRCARSGSGLRKLYSLTSEVIGEGGFGTVSKTRSKQTGVTCVMKVIAKRGMPQAHLALLADEIAIHEMCDHPNIVRIYESFECPDQIHIAMEACDGGDLNCYVEDHGGALAEGDARTVMRQVLQAVFYLHDVMSVAHRDIKPENVLLKHKGPPLEENAVKVIDFGLAHSFTPGERSLDALCGTPAYMAPELLQGPYDEKCDVWSCGVLLHELLSGCCPFDHEEPMGVLRLAARHPLILAGPSWDGVSSEVKAVLRGMLRKSPGQRLSAEQALHAPWLLTVRPSASFSSEASAASSEALVENLRAFSEMSDFQRAALRLAAYHLEDPQVEKQRNAFLALDRNGDGRLDAEELSGCPELGLTTPEAKEIFQRLDTDGSGAVEYSEFLGAAVSREALPRHACWEAFRLCDRDGSGSISAAEVRELLGKGNGRRFGRGGSIAGSGEAEQMDFDGFVSLLRGASLGGA